MRSAIQLFNKRTCSKLQFRNILRINDSLEIVTRYFDALSIFVYAYGAVHLLYVAQSGLMLVLKLGRFAPPPGAAQ